MVIGIVALVVFAFGIYAQGFFFAFAFDVGGDELGPGPPPVYSAVDIELKVM